MEAAAPGACGENEHGSHCPCFLPSQNPSRLHPAEDGKPVRALAGRKKVCHRGTGL